ncbi:unnamed protein product, partial [marine sediment metagenome]
SLIECIERGANHVFQIGGIGTCRASCYGPVQRVITEELGYKVKYTNIDYHKPLDMLRDLQMSALNTNLMKLLGQIEAI